MSKSFFEIRENWASKAQYKNMRGSVKGANKYSGMDKARLKKILSIAQDELDDLQGSRMKAAGGRGLPKGSKQDIADLKDKIANVKAALKEETELDEALTKSKDDPCWDSHVQLGTKKKNGKEVPNCVPKEEAELQERSPLEAIKVALGKKFNKNYPKAIEWMKKNDKSAADAARVFSGVDARELDKMARG
jgi:hypothetical protein